MRVGIDARMLGGSIGGSETYTRNIIRELGAIDPQGDYTLLLSATGIGQPILGAEHMRQMIIKPHKLPVPNPFSIALALARARVDVVHATYMAPWPYPVRIVVSVHDLAFERHPQFFSPAMVRGFRQFVPLTVRRASYVLTLSEFSKMDIVRRYRVPPDKVVVTYLAADPMFQPVHDPAQLAEARARYNTGEKFILCVGNLEPRKNVRALIDAYVRLRKADATHHKLVLVGRKAWLHDDIFVAARESGYADELVFTDYVPDDDLVALYNAAEVFVYPSLFEGFGLPPLEAMACGTPVVTSNTSSLPETVGDAALTVDPRDPEALATALATVLRDGDLRARLSERGLRRAQTFSWEKTARTIHDVYQRAIVDK